MTIRKPKIYCQFVDRPSLEPTSGDRINEIRFYRALSTFADVYYNDVLIDWSRDGIGDPDGLRSPTRDYDLYYVRANPDLFTALPHPKITMAYPYEKEVFSMADALIVTTDAWQRLLLEHKFSPAIRTKLQKWYPSKIEIPSTIINIKQTIDPMFLNPSSKQDIFSWKARLTGARCFGFFGRVTDETIPWELLEGLAVVRNRFGSTTDPIAAFAGSIRTTLPERTLSLGQIDYTKMPSLLAACFGTLGQMCADSDFLGSGKVLDAIATGTPIITRRNEVRDEQLGQDYFGTYDHKDEAIEMLWRLCNEKSFYTTLQDYLLERGKNFLPSESGKRIEQRLIDAKIL